MQRLFHSYNKNLSAVSSLKIWSGSAISAFTCFLLAISTRPASAKSQEEEVWHLSQLHRALGSVEIYVTPKAMRLNYGNGDIVVLYRQDTNQVYIYNPAHKAIFGQSFEMFYKRGFIVTSGGLIPIRTWYPKERKSIQYKGQPASIVEIYARGRKAGKPTEINCAEMKVVKAAENFNKTISVIETLYAIPITGSIPIELRLNYSQAGGELWFQTHQRDFKDRIENTCYRLQTSKIVREKKPLEFFAVPKLYKTMKADSDVMNLSDTASDLTNLVLP